MWWTGQKREFPYVKYKVDQTDVLVGPRLDSFGCSALFFNKVKGWLSVTESWVEYPIEANVRWFPWNETEHEFPDTALFGSLKTLHHWIKVLKLPRIYIHCDLGTHRAPSTLGAFLRAYYSDLEAEQIVKTAEVINNHTLGYKDKNGNLYSNPLEYIDSKIEAEPKIKYLIKAIVQNPELDMGSILKYELKKLLPDHLLTSEQLAERNQQRSNQAFFLKHKTELKTLGYTFENNHYGEFNSRNPQGEEVYVYLINPEHDYNPQVFIHISLKKNRKVLVIAGTKAQVFQTETLSFTVEKTEADVTWAWASIKKPIF